MRFKEHYFIQDNNELLIEAGGVFSYKNFIKKIKNPKTIPNFLNHFDKKNGFIIKTKDGKKKLVTFTREMNPVIVKALESKKLEKIISVLKSNSFVDTENNKYTFTKIIKSDDFYPEKYKGDFDFTSQSLNDRITVSNRGGLMEEAFVNEWNKKLVKEGESSAEKYILPETVFDKTVGVELTKNNSEAWKKLLHVPALHIGGSTDFALNSNYTNLLNKKTANNTPKTDVSVGDHQLSMKLVVKGRIRLASPQIIGGEGQALIYHAFDKIKLKETEEGKLLIAEMDQWLKPVGGMPDEKHTLGRGIDREVLTDEESKNFEINHNKFNELLDNIIANNKDFKKAFIWEISTGEFKFDPLTEPRANWFFKFDETGKRSALFSIEEKLEGLANQLNLKTQWKTGGSAAISSSIIDAVLKDIELPKIPEDEKIETEGKIIIDSNKLFEYAKSIGIDCNLINENYIMTESFNDTINRIKKWGSKVGGKAIEYGKNFIEWLKKVYNVIVEIIKKGLGHFLRVLNMEVQVQKLNTTDTFVL